MGCIEADIRVHDSIHTVEEAGTPSEGSHRSPGPNLAHLISRRVSDVGLAAEANDRMSHALQSRQEHVPTGLQARMVTKRKFGYRDNCEMIRPNDAALPVALKLPRFLA